MDGLHFLPLLCTASSFGLHLVWNFRHTLYVTLWLFHFTILWKIFTPFVRLFVRHSSFSSQHVELISVTTWRVCFRHNVKSLLSSQREDALYATSWRPRLQRVDLEKTPPTTCRPTGAFGERPLLRQRAFLRPECPSSRANIEHSLFWKSNRLNPIVVSNFDTVIKSKLNSSFALKRFVGCFNCLIRPLEIASAPWYSILCFLDATRC